MHNGMVETGRGEDVEVGGQHLPALRGARSVRARGGGRLPDLRALPAAAGVRAGADGAGGGAGRAAAELLPGAPGGGSSGEVSAEQQRGGSGETSPDVRGSEAFRDALADDFNTPRAMAEVFELVGGSEPGGGAGGGGGRWRRCSSWSGSGRSLSRGGVRPIAEAEELMAEREEARAAKDFERADEIRDRLAELGWEVRDSADGPRLVPKAADGRARSSTGAGRSPRPKRGRRRVHRVWRAPETSAEELERLCGSPDHQGVVAEVDPYPYGDPRGLLRGEDALLVALDQVQDPRNLGAVCRSAEFAGAAGVIVPERRAAAVTAVTCKASAGAVEHLRDRPRPQPRRLARRRQGGRLLDLGRRRRGRAAALGRRPQRPHRPRPRRRGQGPAPPGRRLLRRPGRPAPARRGRVPERLRRGRRAALRGPPPARLSLAPGGFEANATAFAKVAIWG